MKRYALFVLHDSEGIRPFVWRYLHELYSVCDEVFIVVKNNLSNSDCASLNAIASRFFFINPTSDLAASYALGVQQLNDLLPEHDELILADDSCYGPIYPIEEIFSQMADSACDIWGILPTEAIFTASSIQFFVLRKPVLQSSAWKAFLNNSQSPFLLSETMWHYESLCQNVEPYSNAALEGIDDLVIHQHCPLVMRECFFTDYANHITNRRGNSVRKTFDYIHEHTSYAIDLIWDDLLATRNYYHIKNNLHMNYIIPSDIYLSPSSTSSTVALCFHVYYESLIMESIHYMQSMPEDAHIHLTTSNDNLYFRLPQLCSDAGLKNIASIHLIPARGRSESALLVAFKSIIPNYDYVCFAHDKLTSRIKPYVIGKDFGQQNMDALLKTKEYVHNIISRFDAEPRLGILESFNTTHSTIYREITYGNEWGINNINFEGTVELLNKLDVHAPIQKDCPPISPMGNCFWFRTKALKKLLDYPWAYESFPLEPLEPDGQLNHFIERCLPFVAQDAGCYTAWVSDVFDAQNDLTNLSFLYREQNLLLKEYDTQLVQLRERSEQLKRIQNLLAWRILKRIKKIVGA